MDYDTSKTSSNLNHTGIFGQPIDKPTTLPSFNETTQMSPFNFTYKKQSNSKKNNPFSHTMQINNHDKSYSSISTRTSHLTPQVFNQPLKTEFSNGFVNFNNHITADSVILPKLQQNPNLIYSPYINKPVDKVSSIFNPDIISGPIYETTIPKTL